jgi:hypothetical protein
VDTASAEVEYHDMASGMARKEEAVSPVSYIGVLGVCCQGSAWHLRGP